MSAANDSPLEGFHIPAKLSDVQAKPERYQMVVSEHRRRLRHMLNWQFEHRRCCQHSNSLTCNVHLGPVVRRRRSHPRRKTQAAMLGPQVGDTGVPAFGGLFVLAHRNVPCSPGI